jgi:glycogen(starch) synthase
MIKSKFILLVTYEFPPHMNTGGIGSYMFHLAHLLTSVGHRVTVFSAITQGSEVQKEEHSYCVNYLFPATNVADFREQVRVFFHEYLKLSQVDIMESPEVGASALGIKEDYPTIPLIVRLHTPGVLITRVSNTYQSLYKKLRYVVGALKRGRYDLGYWSSTDRNRHQDPEYRICMLADSIVSPSNALKDFLKVYWCIEKKIEVIPNPFRADDEMFQFPIEGREKIICFVGKLTVLKGMYAFTRAAKQLLIRYPDYCLIFAGRDEAISADSPSMKVWMEEELKEVKDKIVFTGVLTRGEVKQLLSKSRVCVVPSLWENFPTVVMESMAAGAAVAAAIRGGIPEMIKSGVTGYLFDPMHPRQIVEAVKRLLESNEKRELLADNARRWLLQVQVATDDAIIRLYDSVLSNCKLK